MAMGLQPFSRRHLAPADVLAQHGCWCNNSAKDKSIDRTGKALVSAPIVRGTAGSIFESPPTHKEWSAAKAAGRCEEAQHSFLELPIKQETGAGGQVAIARLLALVQKSGAPQSD
jgi:hypothetical protein